MNSAPAQLQYNSTHHTRLEGDEGYTVSYYTTIQKGGAEGLFMDNQSKRGSRLLLNNSHWVTLG